MGYIYKITNMVNKKAYIGVTTETNPNRRWSNHKSHNRQGNGCPFLMKAFKKYGEESFKFEVLIICFDEDVFRFEEDYIKKYNTLSPNGYNVATGGKTNQSFLGKTHSEETRKLLSENAKKHNKDPEVRERARRVAIEFNKTHDIGDLMRKSEKWQKALAEGRIGGHAKTEEGRKKISESLKKYYANNNHTEINRKKHSEAMTKAIGRKVSQYTKEGVFIASFDSIVEAAEKNGLTRGCVQAGVLGYSKTAGGFIWKYNEPKEV
uniref:GIY-YIG domain-containing protein n=1 Tax=viral metagenome TaxID=1070528 RepID=A0A6C0DEF8_9ZZZZ